MFANLPKVPRIFTNFFVLTTGLFVIWMLFFDVNDIPTMYRLSKEKDELQHSVEYYEDNIEKVQNDIKLLRTDDKHLERFARENYSMHKENEDVFIIVEQQNKKK